MQESSLALLPPLLPIHQPRKPFPNVHLLNLSQSGVCKSNMEVGEVNSIGGVQNFALCTCAEN